jgi:deoxyribodipyrimidine photo-lyase
MADRPILVWFKNDLRLADHEPLWRACQTGSPVVVAVVIDRELFKPTALGFPRMGFFRARYLFQSIEALRQRLAEKGGRLAIKFGLPESEINEIVSKLNIQAVFTAQEVAPEECALVERVANSLTPRGVELRAFWHHTLIHYEDIPWPIQRLPDIFTQFRKEVERESKVRPVLPEPAAIRFFEHAISNDDFPELPERPGNIKFESKSLIDYAGGEQEANTRLREYFWTTDSLRSYKETRNGLLGANYSSKLSPALSVGVLSPRTVYHEIKKYERERVANDSTYWLYFELLWRDYFQFVMKKYGGHVFRSSGLGKRHPRWQRDPEKFETWRLGKTGVPFVDANMRELLHTGFMSNRGRQNVASYLTKDLKIDWRWGAAWFESQLIDYDVCSNWLNWAYVAGVGNDPREDRYFNIARQAERYDPDGRYVQFWQAD